MKGRRDIERTARRFAHVAVVDRFVTPAIVREALSDRKVRAAAGDTYQAGRRMYEDVKGSDAKRIAGRLARDEGLQGEIAALVRTAAKAVDTGISRGKRRVRRRIVRFAIVGAGAAWVVVSALKRTMVDRPSPEQTFDNHVAPAAR